MTIIALIKSNEEQRTVAKATDVRVVCQGQQGLYITFTFTELRKIEQVLHVEFDTNPEMWILRSGWIQDKKYGVAGGLAGDNVVGMSIYLAIGTTVTDCVNGTTLTSQCVAIGF